MRIAGAGSSLADLLYASVDFGSEAFERFRSRERGDGGLEPGRLVFLEEFEEFAGVSCDEAVRALTDGQSPDTINVGGPCIVALVLAAQVLEGRQGDVGFYGVMGEDDHGKRIREILSPTPLNIDNYQTSARSTAFTAVLSDPTYDSGHGERSFINNIGASWHYWPKDVPDSFFDAAIVMFGGTAIVPRLHDGLTGLLKKAKKRGRTTVVTTVFDFRNEKKSPNDPWPLGDGDEAFHFTDLLIVDQEEGFRISGEETAEAACARFQEMGASASIITHGREPVVFSSDGRLFKPCKVSQMPVCEGIADRVAREGIVGDTTGCGDNFAGGVMASLSAQLERTEPGPADIQQAVAVGISAGACACFHLGGVLNEERPGQKRDAVREMYAAYRLQMQGQSELAEEML